MAETRYIEGEGRYELAEMVGRGGFATVWRARSLGWGGDVAVKVIPVHGAAERSRALREGQIAEGLRHPNIVETLEVIPGDREVYLVTEYVRGTALDEVVEDYGMEEVIDALSQILEALVYAHGQGIIHRDIKPQNALVDARGLVKLTDFGIAYRAGDTRLTQVGFAVGTAGYIAPEIMSGADPSELTDIYAVGATARTLLARQPDEPPPRLREFVERATSPNPTHRPQSAWEALKLLTGRRDPRRKVALRERAIPEGFSEQTLRVMNGAIAGWLGYVAGGLLVDGAGAAGIAAGLGVLGYLLPRLGALGVIAALAVALVRGGAGLGFGALVPAVGAVWVVVSRGTLGRAPLGPLLAIPLTGFWLGAGLPLLFGALMRPIAAAFAAAAGAVSLVVYDLVAGDGFLPFFGVQFKTLPTNIGVQSLAYRVERILQVPDPRVLWLPALWAATAAVVSLTEWSGRWAFGLAAAVGGGALGYALLISASSDSLSRAMTSLGFAAIIYGLARYLGSRARG